MNTYDLGEPTTQTAKQPHKRDTAGNIDRVMCEIKNMSRKPYKNFRKSMVG